MNEEAGIKSEIIFTTKQLAEILGLSTRRIQQLAEEGVFPKTGRGKYKGIESIQKYIHTLQSNNAGDAEVDYFKERALHERAKREKSELQLGVMKGEMHTSNDIKLVMNDMIMAFRSRILALPTKLTPQLVDKTDMPVILDLLTREVSEALMELSEYDPHVFYAKSLEYVELRDDDEETE
jgi:phage terminase Nu1 subunit (DNA packaging protein)